MKKFSILIFFVAVILNQGCTYNMKVKRLDREYAAGKISYWDYMTERDKAWQSKQEHHQLLMGLAVGMAGAGNSMNSISQPPPPPPLIYPNSQTSAPRVQVLQWNQTSPNIYQPQAPAPPPMLNSSVYPSTDNSHWLKANLNSGKAIELEDGSIWTTDPTETLNASLWLQMSKITVVRSSGNLGYDYLLINTDANNQCHAKFIQMVTP
jgi:hypothetical protein